MNDDIRHMRRAIELAWRGIGRNSPNPLVGCVIVRDAAVVGEGFHLFERIDHAEVIALREAGEKAKGATAYVSVEPCCHFGRTPPCSDALIQAGVTRVVYGMKDPDTRVNGGGEKALMEAGIEVVGHLLEHEIRDQNRFFVTAKEKNRPYVLLKWAMTLDGKIATGGGKSRWISNDESRNIVHHLRNIYDSILTGHSIVLTDNPKLTCRVDLSKPLPPEIFPAIPADIRNPVRVILDALGATCCSPELDIFQQSGRTIIAIAPESVWEDYRARERVAGDQVELLETQLSMGHIDLLPLLEILCSMNIHSVLVEGGPGINAAFLDAGIVDEIAVFIAPAIFGGDMAICPVGGKGVDEVADAWHIGNVSNIRVIDDILVTGKVQYPAKITEIPEEGES